MASDVTREEHQQPGGRVDVIEREVEGEKLVTRHILEQTRRNGDDLAALKTRLSRVEGRIESVEANLTQEIRSLKASFHDLMRNLPKIVSDAMRDALPKRGG